MVVVMVVLFAMKSAVWRPASDQREQTAKRETGSSPPWEVYDRDVAYYTTSVEDDRLLPALLDGVAVVGFRCSGW